ncbi:hypothetical protein V6N12_069394 [Hibiscus sabdariffa]|uniref:Transmembrane protein n=1 Tax=Hibiscus sabdariffa TaxID=183260 RepID=A0ABR2FDW5_9ROSI
MVMKFFSSFLHLQASPPKNTCTYRMKVALILHALVLCCFIVLAAISAYRVFSPSDPPFSSKEEDEDEQRT